MGQFISLLAWDGLRSLVLSTKESKVLMVGLDAAGKTTILFNLKLNEGTCRFVAIKIYHDADVTFQINGRPP
jgi:hypothetical protein